MKKVDELAKGLEDSKACTPDHSFSDNVEEIPELIIEEAEDFVSDDEMKSTEQQTPEEAGKTEAFGYPEEKPQKELAREGKEQSPAKTVSAESKGEHKRKLAKNKQNGQEKPTGTTEKVRLINKIKAHKKQMIISVVAICCAAGLVGGGFVLAKNLKKTAVNVYSVWDFSTTNEYGESSQTSGIVVPEGIQKVMVSDTQTVEKVLVKEGDEIKKGDELLTYDTTLSDVQLKHAEIALSKLELQKKQAENDLKTIKSMRPHSQVLVTPPGVEYIVIGSPEYLEGDGSESSPKYFVWLEGYPIEDYIESAFFQGETDVHIVLLFREHDALNGQIENSIGLHFVKNEDENVTTEVFIPDVPSHLQEYDEPEEPYYEDTGSEYTSAEIAKMRADKEAEIKELDWKYRMAQVELRQKKLEVNEGSVKSTIDGKVTVVRDPKEAYLEGKPVVEVSAGGGYYIDVAMSELELGAVEEGQTVQVNSYMTGTFCEGTIVEISEHPTNSANSWSGGNPNVSYYPFKVYVEESANLQADEYVDISYRSDGQADGSSFYLENQFIRTQDGKSYVYVRNEDGLLEKRTVQTGRDLYGTYTEIRGGITQDDYVAFPYGKNVKDGTKTNEATAEDFYKAKSNGGEVSHV